MAIGSNGKQPHGVMAVARTGPLPEAGFPSAPTVPAVELDPRLAAHLAEIGHQKALRPRALRPERWLSVHLDRGDHQISVAGFQAPYAAGEHLWDAVQNRLTKREAYRQLTEWAVTEQDSGRSVIVGMDGNNWHDWLDPDDVLAEQPKHHRDQYRRLLDEAALFDVEKAFHGPNPPHQMVDTLRAAAQAGTLEDNHGSQAAARQFGGQLGVTHRLKRDGPRMDRIYASPDLPVLRAGICHGHLSGSEVADLQKGEWRCAGSDHALVWAEIDL
jgi:hypothetical protein